MKVKKINILAPVIKGRKGHYQELFEQILGDGFMRVRIDGEIVEITDGMKLSRYQTHNIEIVIDRVNVKENSYQRVKESVDVALNYGEGYLIINCEKEDSVYSRKFACLQCGIGFQEFAPNSFSFNSTYGACPECDGLGVKKEIDVDLIIPDFNMTIEEGGILPYGKKRDVYFFDQLTTIGKQLGFDLKTPLKDIAKEHLEMILNGSKKSTKFQYSFANGTTTMLNLKYRGVIPYIWDNYKNSSSEKIRGDAEAFMRTMVCPVCNGERLKKESLSVKLEGYNISQISAFSINKAKVFLIT